MVLSWTVRLIGVLDWQNLDAGLFFEREVNWLGRDVVQTLEPRVYYLWQAL